MINSKIHIAVTGAGGGVGQSIIKSLENTDYEVVALDGEVLGAGLYATKKSYIIPYSNSPDYIEKTLDICKKEKCRLLFPGLDAELTVLSANIDKFAAIGTTVIVSSKNVIDISDNKMLTYLELTKHDILVPKTIAILPKNNGSISLDYPFILKPKQGGARSKDLFLINSEGDLKSLLVKGIDITSFVAQEYIDGEEYTCGSVSINGECKGVIVMRRILRDGDTYKCFTIRDTNIENFVKKVINTIKPFGACNIQLRINNKNIYILEINARCSGTTAARTLSGFNEPKMIADYLCSGTEPVYEIKEQTILRYWKELIVPNEIIESMKKNGKLTQESYKSL